MAEDKDNAVDKKEAKKPVVKSETGSQPSDDKSRKTLIITVVVLTAIALGLIGTMAYLAMQQDRADNAASRSERFGSKHMSRYYSHGFDGSGRYISTEVTNDSVTTTVYNYKRGVVVAVNKDNVEIAGGGKRTTINTNGDTIYTDDMKPEVNDTVTVTGTTTDGKITATEITVQN
jgi:hypothetical protein